MSYTISKATDCKSVYERRYFSDAEDLSFGIMTACIGIVGMNPITKKLVGFHLSPTAPKLIGETQEGKFTDENITFIMDQMNGYSKRALFGCISNWKEASNQEMYQRLLEKLGNVPKFEFLDRVYSASVKNGVLTLEIIKKSPILGGADSFCYEPIV